MNVKIKSKNLRFKISNKELETLIKGHPIHEKIELFDKTLVTSINPNAKEGPMKSKLVLDDTEAYLNLCISSKKLQELLEMGPSRDGMKIKTGNVSVTLQVDMPEACHR